MFAFIFTEIFPISKGFPRKIKRIVVMQAYPWPFLVNTSSIAQLVRYPNSNRRNSLQFDWIHSGTLIVSYVFRYLDDVALHHLVDALCRLSSTSMEQAQSNKVTEKFRVNFMALVRSIFNLEMFSRGFQVLDKCFSILCHPFSF